MPFSEHVVFLGGKRVPFARAGGEYVGVPIYELERAAAEAVVADVGIPPGQIGYVDFGNTVPDQVARVPGRDVILESNVLPHTIPGCSTAMFCITGFRTACSGAEAIMGSLMRERLDVRVALCGGGDSMTMAPLYVPAANMLPWKQVMQYEAMPEKRRPPNYADMLAAFQQAAHFDRPEPPAIAERKTGLTMLQHAELMVSQWGIERGPAEEWTARSHTNAAAAVAAGLIAQDIVPMNGLTADPGVRGDTTVEKLAGLKPVEPNGTITAGTATGLFDGASAVALASAEAAESILGRRPRIFLVDWTFDGIPIDCGLLIGPALSLAKLLRRNGLTYDDLAVIELHEAFAAQALCVDKALTDGFPDIGLEPFGALPVDKVNPWGGSLAYGHPFSATGGRIMTQLARELEQKAQQTGTTAVGAWIACAAGGMSSGGLMIAKPE